MKYLSKFVITVFCVILFSLSSQVVFSQDFSSMDKDLQLLEDLINDTITNTAEQEKLLQDLRESLNESGTLIANYENIITGQETLLKDLQTQLNAMSETFKMQSALLARSERRSRFWRNFTLIAIPTAALISGGIVFFAMQ